MYAYYILYILYIEYLKSSSVIHYNCPSERLLKFLSIDVFGVLGRGAHIRFQAHNSLKFYGNNAIKHTSFSIIYWEPALAESAKQLPVHCTARVQQTTTQQNHGSFTISGGLTPYNITLWYVSSSCVGNCGGNVNIRKHFKSNLLGAHGPSGSSKSCLVSGSSFEFLKSFFFYQENVSSEEGTALMLAVVQAHVYNHSGSRQL